MLSVADTKRKHRRQWRGYRTAAGGRPVKDFLARLTDEEVAAIVAGMKAVAEGGLGESRHLRGDVYEVRADASTRSFRLLFSAEGRYAQVLLSLSLFEKRTRKAPSDEIELAEAQLSEWRRRGAAARKLRRRTNEQGS
jgi:phage-related protein